VIGCLPADRNSKFYQKIDKRKSGFGALWCSRPEAGGVNVPTSPACCRQGWLAAEK